MYKVYGAGRPKSPLYGIWNVEDFTVDGQARPPLITDATCWRRLVFDFPQFMSIRAMDDKPETYRAAIDEKAKTLAITKLGNDKWKAEFSFTRPAADQLIVEGVMDNHKIHAQMKLFDRSQFLLVTRGFHWIQDYPFNK